MLRISLNRRLACPVILILLVAGASTWPPARTQAQASFNSGSTGADGAFSPTSSQSIQVPPGGVFNFTTVSIPSGVTVTFTRNAANTPLTILASGNVTIAGVIQVSGLPGGSVGGFGGPGGLNGGTGGYGFNPYAGIAGQGAGGGGGGGSINGASFGGGGGGGFAVGGNNGAGQNIGQGGATYGSATGIPFIGGSGGGGGGAALNKSGGAGGGGGGAILIASSGAITITGQIQAQGGTGARIFAASDGGSGGGGSGGYIRLMANAINGSCTLNASGGNGGGVGFGGSINGGNGGAGYIRVEAFDRNSFTANTSLLPISFGLPGSITLTDAPRLRITSIGGVAAPASPLGSAEGLPDVTLPSTQTNPIAVAVEATSVPLSTTVQVSVIPSAGTRASFACGQLTGSDTLSTATANVTLPVGMSVLVATAVIDTTIAGVGPILMDGERVTRMEIAASLGGVSQVTYVTTSGKRIIRSE